MREIAESVGHVAISDVPGAIAAWRKGLRLLHGGYRPFDIAVCRRVENHSCGLVESRNSPPGRKSIRWRQRSRSATAGVSSKLVAHDLIPSSQAQPVATVDGPGAFP